MHRRERREQGQTQLVGIVAGLDMLLVLFFLTGPLALAPTTALAAVILVAAVGLFDYLGLQKLWAITRREASISLVTTASVLILGVLEGVVLAIGLSLLWILAITLRPRDAVLGRIDGLPGFRSKNDYPAAATTSGLILYRFNAEIVFYDVDYFRERVLRIARRAKQRPLWVVVDLAPVSFIDATALERFDALREDLARDGITLAVAAAKRQLIQAFDPRYAALRQAQEPTPMFATLEAAVQAFAAENRDAAAG